VAGGINVGNMTVSLAATLVDRRESSRRYMKFGFGSFWFLRGYGYGKEGRTRESCKTCKMSVLVCGAVHT
jgi:hypothetical protein